MDQEWALPVEDLLHPRHGEVARAQALRCLGVEALRELLARTIGPPLEANAAGTVVRAATGLKRDPSKPTNVAITLMCDVLVHAGLPCPSFRQEQRTTVHVMDGADREATEWRHAGALDGVEAAVRAETAWWSPQTVARESVTFTVHDRRTASRTVTGSSAPPWRAWDVHAPGAPLVDRAWLEKRAERMGLTLRWLMDG